MAIVLPHAAQNPRSANGEDRYQLGSELSHRNDAIGKCTNASAGAPECLRHIEQ